MSPTISRVLAPLRLAARCPAGSVLVSLALAAACAGPAGTSRCGANDALPSPLPAGLDPAVRERLEPLLRDARETPADVDARARLGRALAANGLFEPALDELDLAACLAPADPLPAYYAAIMAEETGRADDALLRLGDLARSHPAFAPGRHRLGLALLARGRVAESSRELEAAAGLEPASAVPVAALAEAALRDGRPGDALSLADRALELAPGLAAARYLRGLALRDLGRRDDAARALLGLAGAERLHMADPWSGLLAADAAGLTESLRRASGLMEDGRFDEAAAALDELAGRHPGDAAVAATHAIALRRAGRPEEAERVLALAARRGLDTPALRVNRALVLADLGRIDEAVREAGAAVERAPALARARLVHGELLRRAGRLDEALRTLEAGADAAQNDVALLLVLGETRIALGDSAGATDAFERAAALAPGRWGAHARLAQLRLAAGDVAGARRALNSARAAAPDRAELDALMHEIAESAAREAGR